MLILSPEQVKYCQVIRQVEDKEEILSGLIYKNKLFVKEATYGINEQEKALQMCRQNFLDRKPPILPLIIEEKNDLGVWIEDPTLRLAKELSQKIIKKSAEKKEKKQEPKQKQKKKPQSLKEIAQKMGGETGVNIKTRWQNFQPHDESFLGSEAVSWLANELNLSREEAIQLGQQMLEEKIIQGITDGKRFTDRKLLYRFTKN